MEGLALTLMKLALAAVGAGALFALRVAKGWPRLKYWHEIARAVGLTSINEKRRWGFQPSLTGNTGRLHVQLDYYQCREGRHEYMTRVTVSGLGHGQLGLSLRQEGLTTAVSKAVGGHEIEIGDKAFDDEVYLQGPAPLARALLDAETRRLVLELLRGRTGTVWAGLVNGVLQAGIPADPGVVPSLHSREDEDVLAGILSLARRLVAPADIPARIAENLRSEPEAGVRLQSLLTLVREFPEHPAAREVLLAAREDPDAEVRLRAGIALGPEGRDVLLAVAGGEGAPDATTARAVAALADRLTLGEAEKILRRALRTGRETTAAECLEILGRRHGPEAIPTLAKVLAVEPGAQGVAAAQALGATEVSEAEPPLVDALGRDSREVRVAAAQALGRVGGASAVRALREAAERHPHHGDLSRVVRQAIAEIQARLAAAAGAAPGQLSLAGAEAGQVSLVEGGVEGRLTLAEAAKMEGRNAAEEGPLSPERIGVEEEIVEEGPPASVRQARRSQTRE